MKRWALRQHQRGIYLEILKACVRCACRQLLPPLQNIVAAVFLVLSFAERRAFGPNNGAVELIHSQVVIDAPEL